MGGLLGRLVRRPLARLPRGGLDEASWRRRHHVLTLALVLVAPVLVLVGVTGRVPVTTTATATAVPLLAAAVGRLVRDRRGGAVVVTAGACAAGVAVVVLSGGAVEATFAFLVATGFLGLYQHWLPPAAVVVAAGAGRLLSPVLGFPPVAPAAVLLHVGAVLLAAVGTVLLLDQVGQDRRLRGHQEATGRLLIDLARRRPGLPARQLDILRDLEETVRDPHLLGELDRLDVLAARMWRDAESLLVLSGGRADREGSPPMALRDVVRAAVAEIERRDRVAVDVDDRAVVVARAVPDLTHLLAELVENATHAAPLGTFVRVVARDHGWRAGALRVVVGDAGAGMAEAELAAANALLAGGPTGATGSADGLLARGRPGASAVGLRVVARLAARHRIEVALRPGTTGGLAAVLVLPESVLAPPAATLPAPGPPAAPAPVPAPPATPAPAPLPAAPAPAPAWVPRPSTRPLPAPPPAPPVSGPATDPALRGRCDGGEPTAPIATPADPPGWTGGEWFLPVTAPHVVEPERPGPAEPDGVPDLGAPDRGAPDPGVPDLGAPDLAAPATVGDPALPLPRTPADDEPGDTAGAEPPRVPAQHRRSAPLLHPETVPAPPAPHPQP